MDDYVTLKLETYNEMYDKVKKFDSLNNKTEDGIDDVIEKVNEPLNEITEEKLTFDCDVELINDEDGIPAGTKGKDLQPDDSVCPYVAFNEAYDCTDSYDDYENVRPINRCNLRKLNKEDK